MAYKRIGSSYLIVSLAGMVMFLSAPPAAAAPTLTVTGVGLHDLGAGAPEGLSGLAYAGGDQYYAVEDSDAKLHPMTIQIDSSTGIITASSFGTHVTLSGADLEGLAYNSANSSVYVSDETGATITEYDLAGNHLSSVSVPAVYGSYRSNYSLESLSRQAGGHSMWTANEEALYKVATGVNDGPLSTTGSGTVVRLQKFDSNLDAAGQWAYVTEPITGEGPDDASYERSGVSDLCVLPNGKILVLERELDVIGYVMTVPIPKFHSRIYEVEFTGADDVSGITSLEGASYTPLTKHLLWHDSFTFHMFEGLALGPQLDNGDYSLLMVSDGDGAPSESLYSLRLSGDVPEPATAALLLGGGFLGLWKRRRRK